MENTETLVWCDFILACDFITEEKYEELILNFQLNNPESVIRIIDFNS